MDRLWGGFGQFTYPEALGGSFISDRAEGNLPRRMPPFDFQLQGPVRSELPREHDRRVQSCARHGRRQPDGLDHRGPEEGAHERVLESVAVEKSGDRFDQTLNADFHMLIQCI